MITTNINGTALSAEFNNAVDGSVTVARARVMIDWLDSRHLEYTSGGVTQVALVTTNDAHADASKGSTGQFFAPEQATNGWERQAYLWGVCGALDANGQTIRADGRWSAMPDENKSKYEFGWWSGTRSSAVDGSFTTDPYVQIVFDAARVSHIRVNTSEYYGKVKNIKVEYRVSGSGTWTVHQASVEIPVSTYYYETEINNGEYLTLDGIRVTAISTRNKDDFARFNEIIPIYREDISSYIISFNIEKVHSLHNSSLPVGATAANSGGMSLDNTSERFSPFATTGLGPYIKKDIKVVIDIGLLVDEASDTYEYVPYGTFWIDNWNISNNMTVNAQFRDFTKFLSELVIDDGFFITDAMAGKAVTDLALKTNFPRADTGYLKRFEEEVSDKGGILHLAFTDGNPFNESITTNTAANGVWANWWNKSQDRLQLGDGVDLEYNALRDTFRTINIADSPTAREVVSDGTSSGLALSVTAFNNGNAAVFASAQEDSSSKPYYINARFYTFYVSSVSGNVRFRFTVKNGGLMVKMNDELIVDEYTNIDTPYDTDSVYTVDVGTLRQNAAYEIIIDYYHWYGNQKLIWEYSTNSGSSWSAVPTTDTRLAIVKDSIGVRETYGDNYNHGLYNTSGNDVQLSQVSGVVSDAKNRSSVFNNTSTTHYQHVSIPYDASFNLADSSAANYTGEYSIEALAQFDASIGGKGVYAGNIDNANSASKGIGLFYTSSANGAYLYDGSQLLTVSTSDASAFGASLWTHAVATYDGTTLRYYVNSVLKDSATGSGHTSWASQNIQVGKSTDNSSGSSVNYYFDGKLDEFALYNKALSAADVLENYYVIKMTELPIYGNLWGNETDVFALMQEIATADLGMFYFDEYNKFKYHHYNRFYESFIDQHALVQKTISDDSFVVSGSTPIDLQANKVTITVNNPTTEAAGLQSVWRAPSPTSLTVAGLVSDMINSQVDAVTVTTTEGSYPWFDSGYLKIDNEIMQYNDRTANKFTGLTRGMFGTTAAAHTAIVDGVTTPVREVKYFQITYSQAPSIDVRYPLIALIDYEDPVLADIDVWEPTPFGGELVISASTDVSIGDLVYIEGKNDMNQLQYFAAVSGVPVNVQSSSQQVVQQSESNHPSIKKYGLKSFDISNKFITSAVWADTIASFIRDKFQDVVMVLSISIAGVPQLQLGDRIKIGTFENLSITNREYWVIQVNTDFDGSVMQSVTLREAS